MNRTLLTLLILSTLSFTTGCSITPKYQVTVDAITAPNLSISPSTYVIKALDNQKDSNGLIFRKYSEKLAQTLNQNGYANLSTDQTAKQLIYFNYGLEKVDEETEVYSQPNISFGIGWGGGYGHYGHYGYYSPFYHSSYYGGGYSTYSKTHAYYNRYITLLAKDQFNKELWRVDVSSVGESKNLRKIIPILIEAAAPYIGTNTAEPVQLVIKDKAVKK